MEVSARDARCSGVFGALIEGALTLAVAVAVESDTQSAQQTRKGTLRAPLKSSKYRFACV